MPADFLGTFFGAATDQTGIYTITLIADDPPAIYLKDNHVHLPWYACELKSGELNFYAVESTSKKGLRLQTEEGISLYDSEGTVRVRLCGNNSANGLGVRINNPERPDTSAVVGVNEAFRVSGSLGKAFPIPTSRVAWLYCGVCGESALGEFGSENVSGVGVLGFGKDTDTGVRGQSESGTGVFGLSTEGTGVAGEGKSIGVYGHSSEGDAVRGESVNGRGLYGFSTNTDGVRGGTSGPSGDRAGVYGSGTGSNMGVHGDSSSGPGVFGSSNSGYGVQGWSAGYWAARFSGPHGMGNVEVTGAISCSNKFFKIDHPLEPTNKYLTHSCVESSEILNLYSGSAVLDAKGEVWIDLPPWFEALNTDFRYQLTPIGGPAPNLHIAQEVEKNRFKIAGGRAKMKVSWQVTGTRNDAYAKAHPMQVEVEKEEGEKGTYLHPVEHGEPEERGTHFEETRRRRESLEHRQKEIAEKKQKEPRI